MNQVKLPQGPINSEVTDGFLTLTRDKNKLHSN
jgi:hypothetical protein